MDQSSTASVGEGSAATQSGQSGPPTKSSGNPGLDGIRAFAIAGVIAYHLRLITYPGGIFGVDIFFVLSGFLITGILLRSWQRTGSVGLLSFYKRRARRLLPALIAMVIAFLIAAELLTAKPTLENAATEAFRGLTGTFNWYRLYRIKPYEFLAHLWSLAIEFQFCLLWPLVVMGLLKLKRQVETIAIAGMLIFLGISAWRFYLMANGAGWPRIYFGSDLRLDAFAAGGAIRALTIGQSQISQWYRSKMVSYATIVGLCGVVLHGILAATTTLKEHTGVWWVAVVVGLSSILIIAALGAGSHSLFSRFFALPPFPQLGRASYGMYLWHYPLNKMTPRNLVDPDIRPWIIALISVVLGFLSFHLIEKHLVEKKSKGSVE